jgi:predicted MFS family arabinose efflux permease
MSVELRRAQSFSILAGASVMLSLGMGMRQSLGLFMGPVTRDLQLSAADFTLALAVQNIVWGVTQPFVGALADRLGSRPVMLAGSLLYAASLAMVVWGGPLGLMLGAGVGIGVALSCTGSALAMSVSARAVTAARRSVVLGLVSAAGSLGTFVAAPLAQSLIVSDGWQFALVGFIGLAAAMLPAAFFAGGADRVPLAHAAGEASSLRGVLDEARRHRGFIVLSAAFFVCGLQLVFITTHLPTFLANCGMDPMLAAQSLATIGAFNVAGSYLFGWLGGKLPKRLLLGAIYILRSLIVTTYFMTPVTPTSTLLFSAAMGMLWLGVVPLVNGLVAEIFGLRFMATLAGVAFFSHQVGSFFGAWGGGLIYDALGSYDLAWKSAVAIGLVAGAAQLMMDDRPTPRMAAAAA